MAKTKTFEKKHLVKKSEDFSGWYTDIILKAGLADYAPTKGCMVLRPYGFAIWKNIQKYMGQMIEDAGIEDAYFPLLIPHSFLEKEKAHVKGFSPELAVVTHGGGKKLTEPLVIRPTSETIIYAMYKKWIKSWRDLPLLMNQWCNIVRWEKRTYLFLRTMEFLWQEGHTCHRTHQGAIKEVKRALKMYKDFYEQFLALPILTGEKSDAEKFPGALDTLTCEALMPSGKALQTGTSHDLGQNFSKSFDITFHDKDGKNKYVWQTCWGSSTRAIGGLVMAHGDNSGLVLPPRIAPIQIVVIPVFRKDNKDKIILDFCSKLKKDFKAKGITVKIDDRPQYTPGWKFNEWELKGVPLRIEVGEREIKENFLAAVRRDTGLRFKIPGSNILIEAQRVLKEIQDNLYDKAEAFLKENTHKIDDYREFKRIMKNQKGFISAFWCENPECEAKIKQETKATTRLLLLDAKEEKGKCIYCGKPSKHRWLFGQAY